MAGSRIWHHLPDGKFHQFYEHWSFRFKDSGSGCLVPGLKYGGKIAQKLGFRVD